MFAGNFAPTGWALCNGQLMPISQNTALFSLLGTTYGGDGKSTFALPNLQGMAPMQQGQGGGLSQRFLGESSGSETVTLLVSEIPAHAHGFQVGTGSKGDINTISGNVNADVGGQPAPTLYATGNVGGSTMSLFFSMPAGGSLPHENMMPYLTVTFIIALQGVFPARS